MRILKLFILCLLFAHTGSIASGACIGWNVDPRLEAACIAQEIDGRVLSEDTAKTLDTSLRRGGYRNGLGLPTKQYKAITQPIFKLSPLMYYEDNINGGNPDKVLKIGSYVFAGDDDLVKEAGIVLGANMHTNWQIYYNNRSYLTASLDYSLVNSLDSDHSIHSFNSKICSQTFLRGGYYLDACKTQDSSKKSISQSKSSVRSIGLRVFETDEIGTYGTGFLLQEHIQADHFKQSQFTLEHERLMNDGGSYNLSATLAEDLNNKSVPTLKLSGRVTSVLYGSKFTLSLKYQKSNSVRFLGYPMQSELTSLSAGFPLANNLALNIGYAKSDNTIDYFDFEHPTLFITFHG